VSTSPLENSVTISGGGAPSSTSASEITEVGLAAQVFAPLDFSASALDSTGALETQAGGHPAALTTAFHFSSANSAHGSNGTGEIAAAPVENPRQIVIDLPPGVVGNPQASPKCALSDLEAAVGGKASCKPATRVGTLTLLKPPRGTISVVTGADVGLEVFNIVPENGYPAEFGVYEPSFARAQLLYASVVGSGANTHVRVTSGPLTEFVELSGVSTIFFGNPTVENASGEAPRALFTNPTDCTQADFVTTIHVDSWQHPGRVNADGTPDFSDPNWKTTEPAKAPPVKGCDALRFNPELEVTPETTQADTPSGYEVALRVPQSEDPDGVATPPLKSAVVTLPRGVSISPAAADGLGGCQTDGPEGIELARTTTSGHCPPGSIVGAVTVVTPLLKDPLEGHLYIAQPTCGGPAQSECTEVAAETGGVFALYLEVEGSGVHIKLKGKVEVGGNGSHSREVGLQPGQIRTTFDEAPQQPFSELKLKLNDGPRAPLANPQGCGPVTTTSVLTPWSSTTPATPASLPFNIDWNANRGACPASVPFAPSFSAGTLNPQAGAFSPFTLSFSRHDREQPLAGIAVHMPPGLLGGIAGIPQCGEPQASAGTCGAASRLGSATAAAGAGSHPFWQSGTVYLTGPYRGAPFGLSVAVPAKAGPYDLGTIVVRAAIYVDPVTAQLTVVSDPLPQSVDGVPLRLKTVNVTVDRPGFTFNPTSCEPLTVNATLSGAQGAQAAVSSRFQVANCQGLPFKPLFSASTQAKTSKANGASLVVKVAQRPGEANIHKVNLQLPVTMPSRLTTLQKACTDAQFNANPAGCPEGSFIGVAKATTPLLNVPLVGPAILVSHGGAAFPDVEFVLQGEGIEIVLDGNTDIKGGITYSRFETVPDAPITSFEANLPEGPHSALAAYGNLCAQDLLMPTTMMGQSGAQVTQRTSVVVTGCRAVTISRRKVSGGSVVLSFRLTAKGTVTVTGKGLKRYRRTLGAGSHQIRIPLARAGQTARRHRRKVRIKVALKSGSTTSSATTTLTL
jgi:hypothetical protein